jgi:hypothetical protein
VILKNLGKRGWAKLAALSKVVPDVRQANRALNFARTYRLQSTVGRGGARSSLLSTVDIVFTLREHKSQPFEVAMEANELSDQEENNREESPDEEESDIPVSLRAVTSVSRPQVMNRRDIPASHRAVTSVSRPQVINRRGNNQRDNIPQALVEQAPEAHGASASEADEELSEHVAARIGRDKFRMLQDTINLLHDLLQDEITPAELRNFQNPHVRSLNELLEPVTAHVGLRLGWWIRVRA